MSAACNNYDGGLIAHDTRRVRDVSQLPGGNDVNVERHAIRDAHRTARTAAIRLDAEIGLLHRKGRGHAQCVASHVDLRIHEDFARLVTNRQWSDGVTLAL